MAPFQSARPSSSTRAYSTRVEGRATRLVADVGGRARRAAGGVLQAGALASASAVRGAAAYVWVCGWRWCSEAERALAHRTSPAAPRRSGQCDVWRCGAARDRTEVRVARERQSESECFAAAVVFSSFALSGPAHTHGQDKVTVRRAVQSLSLSLHALTQSIRRSGAPQSGPYSHLHSTNTTHTSHTAQTRQSPCTWRHTWGSALLHEHEHELLLSEQQSARRCATACVLVHRCAAGAFAEHVRM